MEFDEILAVFGGTLYPDDFHMDLPGARLAIDNLETDPDESSDKRVIWAPLLRGLLCAASGDCKGSLQHAAPVSANEKSLLVQSRVSYYKHFCAHLLRYSPLLGLRGDMDCNIASLNDIRFQIRKSTRSLCIVPPDARAEWSPLQVSEFFTLGSLDMLMNGMSNGPRSHPAHPQRKRVQPMRLEKYACSREQAGLVLLARRLRSFEIDSRYGYHPEASEEAKELANSLEMESQSDSLGAGLICLRQGDACLSPPFTSPILLNLYVEGRLTGWSIPTWDGSEENYRLRRSPKAERLYTLADQFFSSTQCRRGRAAVALRLGCICIAEAIACRSAADEQQTATELAFATRHLEEAHNLFSGEEDHNGRLLTRAHQTILAALRGSHRVAVDMGSKIGRDCHALENVPTADFIGTLFLRTARVLQGANLATDDSICLCQCARQCLANAGDAYFLFHAYLAEITACNSVGSAANALTLLYECEKARDQAKTQILGFQKHTQRHVDEGILLDAMASSLQQDFASAAKTVLGASWARGRMTSSETQNGRVPAIDMYNRLTNQKGPRRTLERHLAQRRFYHDLLEFQEEEPRHHEKLTKEFNRVGSQWHEYVGVANMEAAESRMYEFIEKCKRSKAPSELVHVYAVMAFYALGNVPKAREWLSGAISVDLGGSAPRHQSYNETGLFVTGPVSKSEFDCERLPSATAMVCCAEDWKMGGEVLAKAEEIRPGLVALDEIPENVLRWKYLTQVAAILEHNSRQKEAFRWYMAALEDIERIRGGTSDYDVRVGLKSSSWIGLLYDGLIRLSLEFEAQALAPKPGQTCNLAERSWKNQALVFLERSLAGALSDSMAARSNAQDDLESVREYERLERHYVEFKSVNPDLLSPSEKERHEKDMERLRQDLRHLDERRDKIALMVRETRHEISSSRLFSGLQSHQLALCTWASREGLIVFGVTNGGIQQVHQAVGIRDIDLRKHALGYVRACREHRQTASLADLISSSDELSCHLLRPFETLLAEKKHVIFVPFRAIQPFPFSALRLGDQEIIFTHAVSQTPSLLYLADAALREQTPTSEASLISNPHMERGSKTIAPMIAIGTVVAAQLWQTTPIRGNTMRSEAFARELRTHRIVHVGTHGTVSARSPMQSTIALERELRVIDLVGLESQASLVIFAACLSGLGQATAGNDFLGFSHTVLQSGAQAYMGALWEVSDWATMVFMYEFHRQLVHLNSQSIARAWQQTQVRLRQLDTQGVVRVLKEIKDLYQTYGDTDYPRARLIDRVKKEVEREGDNLRHPFYYLPFTLVGLVY
ncbi:hypothetical protein KC351_g5618 [Hortaea werneckii]|nr:hypothetical protein KC351_g5618 [Hortaea werneckii]